MTSIADQVAGLLASQKLADRVTFRISENGLIIGMVADDVFFAPASANRRRPRSRWSTPRAGCSGASPTNPGRGLREHVAGRPQRRTNWELAADRAVKVLRRLTEQVTSPATGSGGVVRRSAPLADDGGDPLSANRRVDLVVLSSASDDIRKYLPQIAAQRG